MEPPPAVGDFSLLVSVVVLNWMKVLLATSHTPGRRVNWQVRKTGEALSPCVFVEQPAATAASAAMSARGRESFFMHLTSQRMMRGVMKIISSSLVSLRSRFRKRLPSRRDLPEPGNHALAVVRRQLEDAADHRRAAVADHQAGLGVAGDERDVLALGDVDADRGLALLDGDVHR